ncbi:MAG: helix-turn-helix transcriptional regulator [Bacteroidota bacterium]
MKIGTAIKNTRVEKGLSQGELAKMIEISPTSLSQIENNIKTPSSSSLKKISSSLKVPEVYFYLISLEKDDVPEDKKNLYDLMYPSITEMVKKLVI